MVRPRFPRPPSAARRRPALALLAAVLLALLAALMAQAQEVRVIVHPDNGVSSLSRAEVSRLFLRKVTSWEDGTAVVPVDQTETSPVRESFTAEVHGKDVSAVKAFWNGMIFSGRGVPPAILSSDAEVLDFVRGKPGAIGYVGADAEVPGVKVLRLTE